MRRIPRDPLRFDVFGLFAKYGRQENLALQNPDVATGFVATVRRSVERSLANEAFLHGLRTEALFEALVASLGEVQLLKREDLGDTYALQDGLEVPDFRIVLPDGKQFLVEVKNFYQGQSVSRAFHMGGAYLSGLRKYSQMMGCELNIAVYWAKWNMWTLVAPEAFEEQADERVLTMKRAILANRMSTLGDVHVGTKFPLRLVLVADERRPRTIDENGYVQFTVSGVEIHCADARVNDPTEKRIAGFLMFYGDWIYEGPEARRTGNELDAVVHTWMPPEDNRQGFEIIGALSGMFSSRFRMLTSEEDEIRQLMVDEDPGELGRLIPDDYKGKALPLWRFVVKA